MTTATTAPILIELFRSCDACGTSITDPDECLCSACKTKARARLAEQRRAFEEGEQQASQPARPYGAALTADRIHWSEAIHSAMFRMIALMSHQTTPEARAQVETEFPELARDRYAMDTVEHSARCLAWFGSTARLIARGSGNWDYFQAGNRIFSVPNHPGCKASFFGDADYYRQQLTRDPDAFFGPWPAASFTGYPEA